MTTLPTSVAHKKAPVIRAVRTERKMNAQGGWDVIVHVPMLSLKKAVGAAKAEAIMKAHPNGTKLG